MDYVRHHVQRYARHVLQLGSATFQDLGLQDPESIACSKDPESKTHRKGPAPTAPKAPSLQHPPPQLTAKKPIPLVTQSQKGTAQSSRQKNLVLASDLVPAEQKLNPRPRAISESSIGGVSRRGAVVGAKNGAGPHKGPEAR